MGLPVKLSDDLVTQARAETALSQRSLTGQVEYWARLGQKAEMALSHADLRKLAVLPPSESTAALKQALSLAFSEAGTAAAREEVSAQHGMVYEAATGNKGLIVQVVPDGTRTLGRLVKRKFIAGE
jgi:ParD-like antitoxin of type II bacterial toxin-antitoxin system